MIKIYQTEEGWYWTLDPGFSRPVGPFQKLAEVVEDLQNVMAIE